MYLPELLPGATNIDKSFSLRHITESEFGALGIFWYIPAVMWRWSLKATLWLWFPLAFLLRPDKATDNVGKVRKEAVTQIWVSDLLSWVAIITAFMAWYRAFFDRNRAIMGGIGR